MYTPPLHTHTHTLLNQDKCPTPVTPPPPTGTMNIYNKNALAAMFAQIDRNTYYMQVYTDKYSSRRHLSSTWSCEIYKKYQEFVYSIFVLHSWTAFKCQLISTTNSTQEDRNLKTFQVHWQQYTAHACTQYQ